MAGKTVILVMLLSAIGIAFYARSQRKPQAALPPPEILPIAEAPDASSVEAEKALPRLIDLGADKCIPCKMMAPILEEMKEEYKERLEVVFIDVWKNPDAGKVYDIRVIPTQIFFDASGVERFRHEGFYSKEDMLAKWKEFGVDLEQS